MKEFSSLGKHDIHTAAHLFQPDRLTLARELSGITKQELAERIGKTASAISQFESSNRVRPDGGTVGQLALALSVPVQFFTRKMENRLLSMDSCHFRSLRNATQKQRKKILAMGSLLHDLLNFCESRLELPEEKLSFLSREVISFEDIEKFATEVRIGWGLGLGPIPNMIKLYESQGILVSMMPDSCKKVNAFSTWIKGRPFVFLVNHGSPSLIRFDAGHELLHLLAHEDVAPGDKFLERQADWFGGSFLLPRDSFFRECPRRLHWNHFRELKYRWGVPYRCLIMRAYQLGSISEASYRRGFMTLNQQMSKFSETDEPKMERPSLLSRSLEIISEDISFENLASTLGLNPGDLRSLVNSGEI